MKVKVWLVVLVITFGEISFQKQYLCKLPFWIISRMNWDKKWTYYLFPPSILLKLTQVAPCFNIFKFNELGVFFNMIESSISLSNYLFMSFSRAQLGENLLFIRKRVCFILFWQKNMIFLITFNKNGCSHLYIYMQKGRLKKSLGRKIIPCMMLF